MVELKTEVEQLLIDGGAVQAQRWLATIGTPTWWKEDQDLLESPGGMALQNLILRWNELLPRFFLAVARSELTGQDASALTKDMRDLDRQIEAHLWKLSIRHLVQSHEEALRIERAAQRWMSHRGDSSWSAADEALFRKISILLQEILRTIDTSKTRSITVRPEPSFSTLLLRIRFMSEIDWDTVPPSAQPLADAIRLATTLSRDRAMTRQRGDAAALGDFIETIVQVGSYIGAAGIGGIIGNRADDALVRAVRWMKREVKWRWWPDADTRTAIDTPMAVEAAWLAVLSVDDLRAEILAADPTIEHALSYFHAIPRWGALQQFWSHEMRSDVQRMPDDGFRVRIRYTINTLHRDLDVYIPPDPERNGILIRRRRSTW